jgi:hypothetical protein
LPRKCAVVKRTHGCLQWCVVVNFTALFISQNTSAEWWGDW